MPYYDLPPLAALRAFEAAARLKSFKAAASELFVTPTAISHQLKQLEDWLGFRVLERTPRYVSLTPKGQSLFDATKKGFTGIADAMTQIRRQNDPKVLTLSATPAFLSNWLVSRLDEISALLPDTELRLHASDDVMELRPGFIDMAVRYGALPQDAYEVAELAIDSFAPVCSPKLGVRHLEDLKQARLIHIDGRTAPYPAPDWPRWCQHAGLEGLDMTKGPRFTNSLYAVQAAIAGQGVVIASRVLVSDAIASGLLIQPFDETLPGSTYYFVKASGISHRADVLSFRDWLSNALHTRL